MADNFSNFEFDEWNESDDDEVLFESQEYTERFDVEPEDRDAILADDLPVLASPRCCRLSDDVASPARWARRAVCAWSKTTCRQTASLPW